MEYTGKPLSVKVTEQQRELWERAAEIVDRGGFSEWVRRTLDKEAIKVVQEHEAKERREK